MQLLCNSSPLSYFLPCVPTLLCSLGILSPLNTSFIIFSYHTTFICCLVLFHQLDCSFQIPIIYTSFFMPPSTSSFLTPYIAFPFKQKRSPQKFSIMSLTFFSSAIVSPSSLINYTLLSFSSFPFSISIFICPYNPLLFPPLQISHLHFIMYM